MARCSKVPICKVTRETTQNCQFSSPMWDLMDLSQQPTFSQPPYGSHFPGGILFQKLSFFFLSLTVDFSYMVLCRDPNFFSCGFELPLNTRKCIFVALILDRSPMLLWGKMYAYLLSKHTFYPIAT